MDDNEAYQATMAMRDCGGHFVHCLAAAWFAGDEQNRLTLQTAFPQYFAKYLELHNSFSRSYG